MVYMYIHGYGFMTWVWWSRFGYNYVHINFALSLSSSVAGCQTLLFRYSPSVTQLWVHDVVYRYTHAH